MEDIAIVDHFSSPTLNSIYGYTPASNAVSTTAGNGLTGGGTLAASRTLTLGTPSNITNSTTNSVTATSHTHALGFTAAEVYTGSTQDETNLPIGHVIAAYINGWNNRNQSTTLRLHSQPMSYCTDSFSSAGAALAGTWRARGVVSTDGSGIQLWQRTA